MFFHSSLYHHDCMTMIFALCRKGHSSLRKPSIGEHVLEKAIFSRNIGEAIESIGAAGSEACCSFWGATHRVGHHLSCELWVNMLKVWRASLRKHVKRLITQLAIIVPNKTWKSGFKINKAMVLIKEILIYFFTTERNKTWFYHIGVIWRSDSLVIEVVPVYGGKEHMVFNFQL